MQRRILNRWTDAVIWEGEAATVKDAIYAAIGARADLTGANLRRADLTGADLTGANLRGANLRGADLTRADLTGANLRRADLTGANLTGADLRRADLTGANLTGADLRRADLTGANLRVIRDDLYAVLSSAPGEAAAVLDALRAGRVDGSVYQGECACLVGTIANARGCDYTAIDGLWPNASRPAEAWFLGIRQGDTPETSERVKLTAEWIASWIARMEIAFGPVPGAQ